MNRAKITSIFAKFVLVAVITSGMLAMGTQNSEAQAIVATTPFNFSVGSQSYPAGTYEFTLLSEWSLSIRNLDGGKEQFFTIHPADDSPLLRSTGKLIFQNSAGHRNLQAICVPGTGRIAELMQQDETSGRAKSEGVFASLKTSSGKGNSAKQNVSGR